MPREPLAILAVIAILGTAVPNAAGAQTCRPGVAEAARTSFVTVNGNRIADRTYGTASRGAPPLVLLQRFGGSLDDWDPAFVNAVQAERQVIAFDNTGVGESGGAASPTLQAQADDAAAFVHSLNLLQAYVLGWFNISKDAAPPEPKA